MSTTEIVQPTRKSGIRAHLTLRDNLLFLLFALPNLALLTVFTYRPLIDDIRLSFTDWTLGSGSLNYIGLANYREWFASDVSWMIVGNTVVFTLASVVVSMVLGLALAMLLDQNLKFRNFTRSVVFAPFVISGAAIGVAFRFVFDPNFGLITSVMGWFGATPPDFYEKPHWALFMVTFTYIWKNLGYSFVIYLAALQGLNKDLDEAAAIDNASPWTRFVHVTLPQLRPTTYFLSITVLLNTLQVFDLLNTMTRGGPLGYGTMTMVYQIYDETFNNNRGGYGATVATIMFFILLIVTLVQVRLMDRKDAA